MKNQLIIDNLKIILDELRVSPNNYLNLLSETDRVKFVREWNALINFSEDDILSGIIYEIYGLIERYGALKNEFLSDFSISQIPITRFDPVDFLNNSSEEDLKAPTPTPSVTIINEVKNIAAELTKALQNN